MPFYNTVDWAKEVDKLKSMGESGMTLQEIGDVYNVSRERMRQVFKQYKVFKSREEYGSAIKSGRRHKEVKEKQKDKWGTQGRLDTDTYKVQRIKFSSKKSNAKREGVEWDLNFGDLEWPVHCPILGIEIDYFSEGRQENSCSFDRHDPNKGYVKGNVSVVSWRANRIKNDGTTEDHKLIYEWMLRQNNL